MTDGNLEYNGLECSRRNSKRTCVLFFALDC